MTSLYDEPTLAFSQAMSGTERERPRATPAGAFERAREYLRAGQRIDMGDLASDLGIARGTLYRWTGGRDRLLTDAIWAEAEMLATACLAQNRRRKGASLITATCTDFIASFAAYSGVRRFLELERNNGLQLLTNTQGGFRPRLIAWIATEIQAEIGAGRYRAPASPSLLADGIVTIGERFLHHGGDPDLTPDAAAASEMIALLIREPAAAPVR